MDNNPDDEVDYLQIMKEMIDQQSILLRKTRRWISQALCGIFFTAICIFLEWNIWTVFGIGWVIVGMVMAERHSTEYYEIESDYHELKEKISNGSTQV